MILDVDANIVDLRVRGEIVLRNVQRKRLDRLEIVLAREHKRHVLHRVCAQRHGTIEKYRSCNQCASGTARSANTPVGTTSALSPLKNVVWFN